VIVADGRPYPATGLTTALWRLIEPELVPVAQLVTTQRHLDLEALLTAGSRPGSDVYPLVVAWAGRMFLEDGHHKVTRAVLRGEAAVLARVLRREGSEQCP
jgi:hypothetical protein